MNDNKLFSSISLVLLFLIVLGSCKKTERPPLGDYPSDEVNLPAGDLRFFTPFDLSGNEFRFKVRDSISGNPAFFSGNPLSLIAGVKDSAIQGEEGNAIQYLNANDFAKATSFTVAFWEKNKVPLKDQAEFIFSLPSKDYWHNSGMFLMVDHEGAGSTSSEAVVKFAVEDFWFEFTPTNGKMPGNILDNNWHHLAFVYDEATSKMSYYVDGQQLTGLSPKLTDYVVNGVAHGPIKLDPNSVSRFVLGGWNKHVGLTGPTDAWIHSWKGGLDQFRLYNKALSAAEIKALYDSRQ